jgi:hypothetical protein
MSRVMRHFAVRLALIDAHEIAADLGALAVALRRCDHHERAALEREIAVDDGLDGRPGLVDVEPLEHAGVRLVVGAFADERRAARHQHDVAVGREAAQGNDVAVVDRADVARD